MERLGRYELLEELGRGAWKFRPRALRSTTRYGVEPGFRDPIIGFQCAQS